MKHGLRLALFASLLILVSPSARAQVTLGASCSTSGSITIQPNQIVYCTGSVWAIGEEILSSGYVGIGTTSPSNTLTVLGPNNPLYAVSSGGGGYPVTSGTTQTHGAARFGATGYTGVLDIGDAGTIGMWLQSTDLTSLSTDYPILLNPNGGVVGINTLVPGAGLDIGTAGTTLGTMRLEGNTSGYVQLQTAAAAGSWTMTLPTSGGTSGYVLSTNGSGTTSWIAAGSSGTINLGTSASVTNPQRNGDPTTGLFSAATGTVSISAAATDVADFTSGGLNLPGTGTSYKLNGINAIWQNNTNFNIAVGDTAFPTTVSQSGGGINGQQDLALGYQAMNANTTGYQNVGIGYEALQLNTTGIANTAVGATALQKNTIGSYDTAFGASALAANTTGGNDTALGASALAANTTGVADTAVGYFAMANNTTGQQNIAVGGSALQNNTSGSYNTAIGASTLNQNASGSSNVGIGANALLFTSASSNVGIGANALYANSTGVNNTAIGYSAMNGSIGSQWGANNTALGYQAGFDITSGGANIIIGYYNTTGVGITSGSNNILIGQNLQKLTAATSNQLDIGNLIFATGLGSGTTMSTGTVGIGTSSPAAGLDNATNGAASAPAERLDGTWYTGGTATTTKPQLLIEPSGTTSNNWNTNGTAIGINTPSGFTGNLLDFQNQGNKSFSISAYGYITDYGDLQLISNSNPYILFGPPLVQNNVSDILGQVEFALTNSSYATANGGDIRMVASSVTAGSESSTMSLQTAVSGTVADRITIAGGSVGIGTASPQAPLHVNGEAIVGSTSLACSSTTAGALQYASGILQFCNGTTWTTINTAGTGGITPGCGASGTLSTQTQTTLIVAAGCHVLFKAWGGAGGSYINSGGGGGYATITIGTSGSPVTYYLVVGGASPGYTAGGAGVAGYTGGSGNSSAGGGAASGVWTGGYGMSGTPVIIAAGGGGGGGSAQGFTAGGSGGTQNSSTVGGYSSGGGGGGGAGYTTGGAYGASGYSGYGGTNYAASGGSTSAGTNSTPGNSGDANRPTNAGAGLTPGNGSGYPGAIYYSTY